MESEDPAAFLPGCLGHPPGRDPLPASSSAAGASGTQGPAEGSSCPFPEHLLSPKVEVRAEPSQKWRPQGVPLGRTQPWPLQARARWPRRRPQGPVQPTELPTPPPAHGARELRGQSGGQQAQAHAGRTCPQTAGAPSPDWAGPDSLPRLQRGAGWGCLQASRAAPTRPPRGPVRTPPTNALHGCVQGLRVGLRVEVGAALHCNTLLFHLQKNPGSFGGGHAAGRADHQPTLHLPCTCWGAQGPPPPLPGGPL